MAKQEVPSPESDKDFYARMRVIARTNPHHAEEGMAGRAFVKKQHARQAAAEQPKP